MESQNKGGNFYQVQTRPHCNRCAFHCPSFPLPTPYGVATPYNPQQLNPYQQQRINSIRSALRNAQAAQTQEPAATQRHPTAVRQAHPHNPPIRFNTFPQHTHPWVPGFNQLNGLPFGHPANRFFVGYSLPYPTDPSAVRTQGASGSLRHQNPATSQLQTSPVGGTTSGSKVRKGPQPPTPKRKPKNQRNEKPTPARKTRADNRQKPTRETIPPPPSPSPLGELVIDTDPETEEAILSDD